jgi:lipid-binding SYLF domain-containing protein
MYQRLTSILAFLLLVLPASGAWADEYQDTVGVFKKSGQSSESFKTAYGYAVFPTVGKGGVGIGGAYGEGRVYEKGKYVGDVSMVQITAGLQFGGQAYSMIVFLEDERAFREFTGGNFEFGAEASAVAITAGANAKATTAGASAGASGNAEHADTVGVYQKGMAVFTVTKGGLMYEATLGGQKFNYTAR